VEPTPATTTAVDHDAEIASARAERDAAAASPFALESTRRAAEDKFISAYQRKHGGSSCPFDDTAPMPADETIATLSATDARARILQVRQRLAVFVDGSPEYDAAHADLLALYKVIYPESGEAPPSADAAPASDSLTALSERFPIQGGWHPSVDEERAQIGEPGLQAAFDGVLGALTGAQLTGKRYTAEEGKALLQAELHYDPSALATLEANVQAALDEAARRGRGDWIEQGGRLPSPSAREEGRGGLRPVPQGQPDRVRHRFTPRENR